MSIVISILEARCKGCGICVGICQTGVLALNEQENEAGYRIPVVVKHEDCLECGLCEMLCPDFAIWISREKEEAKV